MEQLSSGDKILISPKDSDNWTSIEEVFLEEGKYYKWKYNTEKDFTLTLNNIPLPMLRINNKWEGQFQIPFYSGSIEFNLICDNIRSSIKQYVYPDSRKATEDEYNNMIKDILKEAAVCFEDSGYNVSVDAYGRNREFTWAQLNYILNNIRNLKLLFNKIEKQPIRRLSNYTNITKKEKLKKINIATLQEINKKALGFIDKRIELPNYINEYKIQETVDIYENRVIKYHMLMLKRLLKNSINYCYEEYNHIIDKHINWIDYKLNNSFLNEIKTHFGTVRVTQIFRKSPSYRLWYQWFNKLFEFANYKIGFSYNMPLANTYQIYEIWCFMMIIKYLREENLVIDTNNIFKVKKEGLFLSLGENKLSKVKLANNANITYQRVFQWDTTPYKSYTKRMIPDIVLETDNELIVFDPKYRVENNLNNALSEMHKYRDGVIQKETGKKAIKEAYILAPTLYESVNKNIFDKGYHGEYKMGAFKFATSSNNEKLKNLMVKIIESNF